MKKLIGALLIASPLTALAASGPAGCGLGTAVVFKDANMWYEHVLAATTNGTSGNQTFGMTSGTLGCEAANGPLASNVDMFIDQNIDQLAQDAAVGEGESLAALSELIGVQAEDKEIFNQALKANFDSLFVSEATTSGDVYSALVAIMQQDIALAKYLG